MAVSNVAILSNDSVEPTTAIVRQSGVTQNAANTATLGSPSSITFISASGQSRLSLESFQALATAVQTLNVPPTVSDFEIVVLGVVSGLSGLRLSLANAAVSNANYREQQKADKALQAIDQASKESVAALQKIGIDRQGDGSYTIDQKQLTKAYNEDPNATYATLTGFAAQASQAASSTDENKAQAVAASNADVANRALQVAQVASQAAVQAVQPVQQAATQNFATGASFGNSFQPQLATQLAGATSFAARTAVTTYIAVSSL
ncbi:MAG TPA: hypothetical protein VIE17_10205 [Methylophilaceae bacterium]|jgi:hypothetical protein